MKRNIIPVIVYYTVSIIGLSAIACAKSIEVNDNTATEEPVICDMNNGFSGDLELGSADSTFIEYRAYEGSTMPYQILRVQIFEESIDDVTPGTYELSQTNYSNCRVCVTILDGCSTGPCEQIFYPIAGSIEISKISDEEGDRFKAHLHNVEMEEVTIDSTTAESTPVPGGEDWCVPDYSYDIVLDNHYDARCARPNLPCIGENIFDFELKNCASGEMVNIVSLAQNKKALLFVMVTGWCPYCREWVPKAMALDNQYDSSGLEVIYVYGENANYAEPTLDDCLAYAAEFGDAARFFVDHDGTSSFATTAWNMWPFASDSSSLGVPWNTLVDAETFEYIYTSLPEPTGDLETELKKLLDLRRENR